MDKYKYFNRYNNFDKKEQYDVSEILCSDLNISFKDFIKGNWKSYLKKFQKEINFNIDSLHMFNIQPDKLLYLLYVSPARFIADKNLTDLLVCEDVYLNSKVLYNVFFKNQNDEEFIKLLFAINTKFLKILMCKHIKNTYFSLHSTTSLIAFSVLNDDRFKTTLIKLIEITNTGSYDHNTYNNIVELFINLLKIYRKLIMNDGTIDRLKRDVEEKLKPDEVIERIKFRLDKFKTQESYYNKNIEILTNECKKYDIYWPENVVFRLTSNKLIKLLKIKNLQDVIEVKLNTESHLIKNMNSVYDLIHLEKIKDNINQYLSIFNTIEAFFKSLDEQILKTIHNQFGIYKPNFGLFRDILHSCYIYYKMNIDGDLQEFTKIFISKYICSNNGFHMDDFTLSSAFQYIISHMKFICFVYEVMNDKYTKENTKEILLMKHFINTELKNHTQTEHLLDATVKQLENF